MALPPINLDLGGVDDAAPAPDADDGMSSLIDDFDKLVPGMGALISELVDRLKSEDEEQDAKDMG
jgi:hypothetical protein